MLKGSLFLLIRYKTKASITKHTKERMWPKAAQDANV